MKIDDYIDELGLKVKHVLKELDICFNTYKRMKLGLPISREVADRVIRYTNNQVELNISDRWISNKKKGKNND